MHKPPAPGYLHFNFYFISTWIITPFELQNWITDDNFKAQYLEDWGRRTGSIIQDQSGLSSLGLLFPQAIYFWNTSKVDGPT
jgi:hypothetical protein